MQYPSVRYHVECKGKTPLIMKRDSVEWADKIKAWQNDPANKNLSVPGDDRTPPWTWLGGLYNDGEKVVMPTECVSACLRKAGAKLKLKGNTTYKSLTQSGLVFPELDWKLSINGKGEVPIAGLLELMADPLATFTDHANAVRELGFRLFVKRLPVEGKKHIRVRPRFDDWMIEGDVHVMVPREITKAVLQELFEIAGFYVGLCEWRPSAPKTPGPYGRFEAKVVKL